MGTPTTRSAPPDAASDVPASAESAAKETAPLLLIVEDDGAMRQMCCDLFERRGYKTEGAASAAQALERIRKSHSGQGPRVRLVLSDVRLGRERSGIELLQDVKQLDAGLPVLLMTGYATVQDAVQAMKLGAADYVTKPFERAELVAKVEAQLKVRALEQQVEDLKEALDDRYGIQGLIGKSAAMRSVCERILAAGRSQATVLITGESGTGKELVARAIHHKSARRDRPFVPVNCAALPDHLIESELFGHEPGSFTGATRENPGLFRAADGGTIFLDEVVDMPKDTQAKLLRVLQDRRIRPVGSTRETAVDVRVLAATNADVEKQRADGRMRDDLYYRLSVLRVHIPPLRERLDDLPLLLEHFLAKYAKTHGRRIRRVAPEALSKLASYTWPGNVRELESLVESAYALGREEILSVEDLPDWIHKPSLAPSTAANEVKGAGDGGFGSRSIDKGTVHPLSLDEMEKEALVRALAVAQGNKSKAAQILGVSRKRLYRMLNDYGMASESEKGIE
ncbi:MAG: sigma-54-dependent Fis family transcriptional regulator [Planctomycetes bacterium]|nr:sigma-54-dependent Fis family transcriptional regulator [Planctomycetota bacterium]